MSSSLRFGHNPYNSSGSPIELTFSNRTFTTSRLLKFLKMKNKTYMSLIKGVSIKMHNLIFEKTH